MDGLGCGFGFDDNAFEVALYIVAEEQTNRPKSQRLPCMCCIIFLGGLSSTQQFTHWADTNLHHLLLKSSNDLANQPPHGLWWNLINSPYFLNWHYCNLLYFNWKCFNSCRISWNAHFNRRQALFLLLQGTFLFWKICTYQMGLPTLASVSLQVTFWRVVLTVWTWNDLLDFQS